MGKMTVTGVVANGRPDKYGEVCDENWLGEAFQEWLAMNKAVTYEFTARPVGTPEALVKTDDGWRLSVNILDEEIKPFIRDGSLGALTIGIKNAIVRRENGERTIIGGEIYVVTLVTESAFFVSPLAIEEPCEEKST